MRYIQPNMPPKCEKKLSTISKNGKQSLYFVNWGHHVVNSCQFLAMIEQLFTDCPVTRISMDIIFVRQCKNQNKIVPK